MAQRHNDVFLEDTGGWMRLWEHVGFVVSSFISPNKLRILADLPTTTSSSCISLGEERAGFVASWVRLVE